MPAGRQMQETDAQRMAAFQQLADQRLDATYRLATAILRDDSQSHDAVHDAIVLAWQRWSSLRDRTNFDGWFDRIVVNVCRNRLRDASGQRTTDISMAASLGTPDGTADVDRRILVEQALDELKADDIVVLALAHFLDLQIEDIGVLLDIPIPTAKSRLRSARTRLRAELERESRHQVKR
jgi:RNA polymerase sigma-70 factor (ECF subfamily)